MRIFTNKNNFKKCFLLFALVVCTFIFTSCENESNVDEGNDETILEYSVPEAMNQYAIDKETEVKKAEETMAHHVYDEQFILKPEKEIVIGEKQFLTKLNYIYNNIDLFKETIVTVEGMYGMYTSWDETFTFPMVYRNGPSCCGDDQYGGFYLINIDANNYEIDDWIKVSGMPFMYEHTDSEEEIQKFMFLLVSEIEVLPIKERKPEMVNN